MILALRFTKSPTLCTLGGISFNCLVRVAEQSKCHGRLPFVDAIMSGAERLGKLADKWAEMELYGLHKRNIKHLRNNASPSNTNNAHISHLANFILAKHRGTTQLAKYCETRTLRWPTDDGLQGLLTESFRDELEHHICRIYIFPVEQGRSMAQLKLTVTDEREDAQIDAVEKSEQERECSTWQLIPRRRKSR